MTSISHRAGTPEPATSLIVSDADFARLDVSKQVEAFFVTACQVEPRCSSRLIRRRRIARPACDQTISLDGFYTRQDYPELLRRIRFKDPESDKTLVFITQQLLASGRHHLRALQKPLAGGTLLQVDQAASSDQVVLRHVRERGEDADLDCSLGLEVIVAIVKKRLDLDVSLYTLLQILSVTLFEKMPIHQALAGDENRCNASQITNQLNLFGELPEDIV